MSAVPKAWRAAAGVSGFIALALGAAGRHLATDPYAQSLVEQAMTLQLIHSGLLVMLTGPGKALTLARGLFAAGIVLFCGGLYAKAFLGLPQAAFAAPFGGGAFMLGWLTVAWNALRPAKA